MKGGGTKHMRALEDEITCLVRAHTLLRRMNGADTMAERRRLGQQAQEYLRFADTYNRQRKSIQDDES